MGKRRASYRRSAHPLRYQGADFFSWPPLFQVEQLYEAAYVYDFEGKGEVKFALAADGNLWMWNHQIAGMTGVVFDFAPVMGFLAGLFVVLIVTSLCVDYLFYFAFTIMEVILFIILTVQQD